MNILYSLGLLLASPWLVWQTVRKGKYREGFAEKFLGRVPIRYSDRPCVWLHAVSVGEVNLLGTLIDELRRRRSDLEFVISTTTITGRAVAKSRYAGHSVVYCPLDFSWAVNEALRRVRPDLLVLAEVELWPNLINAAKQHGAKVAVINGRMSDGSFHGYRRLRFFVARLLRNLDLIAVQSPTYADRFRALGAKPKSVVVTGSLKFDGAETDRANPHTAQLKQLAGITDDGIVFLAGSTQEPEERYALNVFRKLSPSHPRLRLILVPRHPDRFEAVARLLEESGIAWQRRSELGQGEAPANPGAPQDFGLAGASSSPRILLVDRMGELGAWWGTAAIAFVGGTFGQREGQNMIEPAAYGTAIAVGPRTKNFRDVVALLAEAEAITVVHHANDLEHFVRRCLENPAVTNAQGQRARTVVMNQLGATQKTADLLEPLIAQHAA